MNEEMTYEEFVYYSNLYYEEEVRKEYEEELRKEEEKKNDQSRTN